MLILSKICHTTAQSLHMGLSRVKQERSWPLEVGAGPVLDDDLGEDKDEGIGVEG